MPFTPHEIEWTPEKSARLWDFYASSPAHWPQYFGAQAGWRLRIFCGGTPSLRDSGRSSMSVAAEVTYWPRSVKRCQRVTVRSVVWWGWSSASGACRSVANGLADAGRMSSFDPPGGGRRERTTCGPADCHGGDRTSRRSGTGGFLRDLALLARPGATVFVTTPNNEDYDASKVCCPIVVACFTGGSIGESGTPPPCPKPSSPPVGERCSANRSIGAIINPIRGRGSAVYFPPS